MFLIKAFLKMLFNPRDLEFDKWNFKLCEFDALFGCKRLNNTDL